MNRGHPYRGRAHVVGFYLQRPFWSGPLLTAALVAATAACAGTASSSSAAPASDGGPSAESSFDAGGESSTVTPGASCLSACERVVDVQAQCGEGSTQSTEQCQAQCVDEARMAEEQGCGNAHESMVACFATEGNVFCREDGQPMAIAPACMALTEQLARCATPSDPVPDALCAAGKMAIAGSVDGTSVAVSEPGGFLLTPDAHGLTRGATYMFPWTADSGRPTGQLRMWSDFDLASGAHVPARGVLRFPTSQGPAGWWCGAKGSTVMAEGRSHRVRLRNLQRMGACPGEPVQGEVTVCIALEEDCGAGLVPDTNLFASTIRSTLAGSSFEQSFLFPYTGVGAEDVSFTIGGLGFAWVEVDGSFGVTGGLLQLPAPAQDAGALYCISETSTLEPHGFPAGRVRMTLRLSRLGKCGEGDALPGSIDACYMVD